MKRCNVVAIVMVILGVISVLRTPAGEAGVTVTNLKLTADRQAPQPDHTTIRWTASASGGKSPYSFKWWVYDGTWRVLQDWTKNASYSWTPLVPNSSYQVRVWVRSSGATSDVAERTVSVTFPIQQAISGLALTPDMAAPQPTDRPITWTASVTAGAAPVSFKWWLSDGVTWTVLRDWNTSSTYTWTPATANPNYTVRVGARGAGLSSEPEQSSTVAYWVSPRITDISLTSSVTPPRPTGTRIDWTANAVGGAAPYTYEFRLYDGAWKILRERGPSATYSWTPLSANSSYQIRVVAWSSEVTGESERSTTVTFPIEAPPEPPPPDGGPGGGTGGCSYSVTPLNITVSAANGTNEVHVSAPSGCPWTADIVDGGVVDYLSTGSGSGTAIITLYVSNNTSPDIRTSELSVAQHRVVVTQVGLAPDPTCNYGLSSASTTIPVDGGSGVVDVITTAGCSWGVNPGASWVRLTGNTGGTGSGSVTYEVDPNSGAGRNTTVYIAGNGFDLLQEGTNLQSGSQEVIWNEEPVYSTQSFIVFRPMDGYLWESYPDVHASQLNECFGNCGAGCSNAFNPCGGRQQWWELQILDQPVSTGQFWQDVWCYGDTYYLYDFERYTAMGRWIYHGHASTGCADHDAKCPEATWIGCLVFTGCGTEWDEDWSYETVVKGSKVINIQEMGPGTCN